MESGGTQNVLEDQEQQDVDIPEEIKSVLSEQQRKYLEMIFKEFDSDGNGSLNVKELGNTVRALGWNPTEEQIREIIKEVDDEGNQNGTLELNEFMILMVKHKFFSSHENIEEEEKEIVAAFKYMDRDNSGFISAQNLMVVLTELGNEPMTIEEAEAIIKEADKNGDGQLDYSEFKAKMTESLLGQCME